MSRVIAIGDLHGCANTFRHMVSEELKPTAEDRIILLGDYVNKGPDSKGVIDFILELKYEGMQIDCLRGNHDQLMLDAWKDKKLLEDFIERGGDATLASFGCKSLSDVPSSYYSFLATTSYFVETDTYYLLHAGFNFEAFDILFDFDAMLNVREMEVDFQKTGGKRIVHGHVPVEVQELKKEINEDWKHISIDTGCPYTDQFDKGYLTALILDSLQLIHVKNME